MKFTASGENARNKKGSSAYNSWCAMIQRCFNEKSKGYARYGAKGITACNEWRSFDTFYDDMGDKPARTSLDRINNDLGYFKENCRWATQKQQCRNTSKTRKIKDKDGNIVPMCDLAEHIGVRRATFYSRMKAGDTGESLIRPTKDKVKIEIYGVYFSIKQIADATGIPKPTMWRRYYLKYLPNMDIDALFAKSKRFQKRNTLIYN